MTIPHHVIEKYFSPQLEFRVRLYNVLAIGGTVISFLVTIIGIFNNAGVASVVATSICTILSYFLLFYSYRSGKYQLCYIVTIIAIFLVLFPIFFFTAGGYLSGMPSFFIFAVLFTVFMLEGTKAIIMSVTELAVYVAICFIAWRWPQTVNWFNTEDEVRRDIIFAFAIVSLILGACMFLHFRIYNQQQKKLDEQNAVLAQANRMKSEFLANASHEMRTPLTVTSVNVQTVMEILEDMGEVVNDPEAVKLLQSAQDEIMRLSRMVGGMLTLASMSESTDRRKLDLTSLLYSGIEILRLNLEKRGNTVTADIESGLSVFGNADLLTQVLSNILQNAGTHTKNGRITISAGRQGNEITIIVGDTGTGISPELLPQVFERGITTGGTGYGLYLCKMVIESHGGRIWIESVLERGTTVFYTLPYYEGQFGGTDG